jgi:multiple sugar transport system substrate-binding protein
MRRSGTSVFAATATIALACSALLVLAPASSAASTPTVHWYARPESGGSTVAAAQQCTKESNGKYRIDIQELPADASAQREQLVRRLAAHDSGIDLISMDVIWTAEFGSAHWVKAWPKALAAKVSDGVIPAVLATGQFRGRMYGAPLNTGSQLLWYRKDLVPNPPTTWDEMIDMAEKLPAGQNKIEVQAKRYEGYTVWFNSLLASAGGQMVKQGKPSLATQPTQKTLEIMKRLATSSTADPNIANADEGTTDQVFNAGKAAFMVNYPFVYAAAKSDAPEVFQNLGVALWPRVDPNEPSHVTLGGFNLGVGAYTKQPKVAYAAAQCLLDDKRQILRATKDGLPPVKESLYDNAKFREANPFADLLLQTFRDGSSRPVSPAYNDISLAVQGTIHPPRNIDPKSDVKALRDLVDDAVNSRGLL